MKECRYAFNVCNRLTPIKYTLSTLPYKNIRSLTFETRLFDAFEVKLKDGNRSENNELLKVLLLVKFERFGNQDEWFIQ
jgi:hypothetical protein